MTARDTRDPRVAGVVGLVVVALLLVLAARIGSLPFVGGGGRELVAEFTDASGLREGDRVEVAGVDVGTVEDITMGRAKVVVRFTIDPEVRLGSATAASIGVGNLLGSAYLEVTPGGSGTLGDVIPIERTDPAYDVVAAFGELTTTVDAIDTERLEEALDSITATFRGSSPDVHAAIRGLSAVSRTIAERDDHVGSLLEHTATLSSSLDASREDVSALVSQAAVLLEEIDRRRASLQGLVQHTRRLSDEVRGLVDDNADQMGPALAELDRVASLLEQRQEQLGETVHAVARFARVFSNTIGSGPWFDSYIGNVPDRVEVREP